MSAIYKIILVRRLLRLLQLDKSKRDEEYERDDETRKTFEETIVEDVVETRLLTEPMSLRAVEKATSLVLHGRFDPFWRINETGTVSKYLLVKGNESDIWPLTFVGTFLYQKAKGMGDLGPFVLGYFCSRHRPSPPFRSEATAPVGIMLSILGQLAEQILARGIQINLEVLKHMYWEKIENRDFKYLGSVFDKLVLQLPRSSRLYCIIDGVDCYDHDGTSDVVTILRELKESVKLYKASGRVGFKLLVMTQRESNVLKLGQIFKKRVIDIADLKEPENASQRFQALFGENEPK